MSQSRRQRRQLAKQFGFLGKKESLTEREERTRRAHKMGKQIHLRNLENIKNYQIEEDLNREKAIQNSLARDLSNKKSAEESKIEFNPGSFDFLNDVKEGPQASEENGKEDNV
jgi:hypothetical protein